MTLDQDAVAVKLALQDWIQKEEKTLPTQKRKLKGTEIEVPAPDITPDFEEQAKCILQKKEVVDGIEQIKAAIQAHSKGNDILLAIATKNKGKADAIRIPFQKAVKKNVISFKFNVDSNVGEQPYTMKTGVEGCSIRAANIFTHQEHINTLLKEIEKGNVGQLIIGSIESYIEAEVRIDGEIRAVDYAAVVFFNPVSNVTRLGFSMGLTVPKAFFEAAQSVYNYIENGMLPSERVVKKKEDITVGECIYAWFQIDKGNWHEFFHRRSVSRYITIRRCIERDMKRILCLIQK